MCATLYPRTESRGRLCFLSLIEKPGVDDPPEPGPVSRFEFVSIKDSLALKLEAGQKSDDLAKTLKFFMGSIRRTLSCVFIEICVSQL